MYRDVMFIVYFCFLFFGGSCCQKTKIESETKAKKEVKEVVSPQLPMLHVYNMGGVPQKNVEKLVDRLKVVYANTEYSGTLSLVDSAYIKNDPKGINRYWWSKLHSHMMKTMDTKNDIHLVIFNGEVCNWDSKTKSSHANMGISNLGGHISVVSYMRLKKNGHNNTTEMLKIAIHELGHSVGRLVGEWRELRCHCPKENCLMRDANNHYPYGNITSFCKNCDKVMKEYGFQTDKLGL